MSRNLKQKTRSEDIIPPRQKFGWAAGGFMENGLSFGITALAYPIYNIALGVPAQWLGWALAIPRFFDAITDLLIGNLSDNTRSRWGRRRPYMFIGAIISGLAFSLIWIPPLGFSDFGRFIWFLIFSSVMFLSFGLFLIPWYALGYELSPDSAERTRMMSYKIIAANLAGLAVPWLYWLSQRNLFNGDEIIGIRYIGVIFGSIALVTGLLPAILCKEKKESYTQPKIQFIKTIKSTISNKPFVFLTMTFICCLIGTFIISPLTLYILIYHVAEGDKSFGALLSGLGGWGFSIFQIILSRPTASLGNRWGKRNVLCLGIIIMASGYLLSWFLYTPNYPWLSIIPLPIMCIGSLCIYLLHGAMVADICDIDELESGFRRQGIFAAVTQFVYKSSIALSSALTGYLVFFSGFNEGEIPSVDTILTMRILYVIFPTVLLLVAFIFAWFNPLNDDLTKETTLELKKRKIEEENI
ncbi:MAG: hypothetical protein CMG75_05905 [Candidatus Marinimicrobia bacterium]|nr:hypothetical protein [Candidatus Neomarinimicrobiota bacterium]